MATYKKVLGDFSIDATSGNITLTADTVAVGSDSVVVTQSKTPGSPTATGTAGEICWDADYIYVCTATNTWKRAALSTWSVPPA